MNTATSLLRESTPQRQTTRSKPASQNRTCYERTQCEAPVSSDTPPTARASTHTRTHTQSGDTSQPEKTSRSTRGRAKEAATRKKCPVCAVCQAQAGSASAERTIVAVVGAGAMNTTTASAWVAARRTHTEPFGACWQRVTYLANDVSAAGTA